MNSVRSSSLSLKYQRLTPSRWRDIGIRQFEFVAKNQFLFIFRQSIGLVLELNFSWKLTFQQVNLLRLDILNQTKNILVLLPSSRIKI